jgi:hypothetical protein
MDVRWEPDLGSPSFFYVVRIKALAPVAQLDRALVSETKGRTFESSRAHAVSVSDHTRFSIYGLAVYQALKRRWINAGRQGRINRGAAAATTILRWDVVRGFSHPSRDYVAACQAACHVSWSVEELTDVCPVVEPREQ